MEGMEESFQGIAVGVLRRQLLQMENASGRMQNPKLDFRTFGNGLICGIADYASNSWTGWC
jgi:hypothetical protein